MKKHLSISVVIICLLSCAEVPEYDKCGDKEFAVDKKFCFEGNIYEKCDGKEYNPKDGPCLSNATKNIFDNLMIQETDLSKGANWSSANSICQNSNVGGYSDWRLPKLAELGIIYSNKSAINGLDNERYWSSEMNVGGYYYCVSMKNGSSSGESLYDNNRVRCVRTIISGSSSSSDANSSNSSSVSSSSSSGGSSSSSNISSSSVASSSSSLSSSSVVSSSSIVLTQCPSYNSSTHFCDTRDYKVYKYVKIDTQTWMAENLNFEASGSKCYGNNLENCEIYGRLYDWATAMNLASSCNTITCISQIKDKHKGICPDDWHVPSNTEWSILVNYVDGTGGNTNRNSDTAGEYLKATSGWDIDGVGINGIDKYGFAALPGGYGHSSSNGFNYIGEYGEWWTANEYDAPVAYNRNMYYGNDNVNNVLSNRLFMFSIRCVKD